MKLQPKLKRRGLIVVLLTVAITGCAFDALLYSTASLGSDTAGERGSVQVLFINNTPYRAIFTFGAYDDLDRNTEPVLLQFSSADDTLNLEGNTQSDTIDVECHRVFSIGGDGLIARVHDNLDEGTYDETPLVSGVHFSSAEVGDDLADRPIEGQAAPYDAFIGADFECGSLVIYRFEVNDFGTEAFKVEMSVIPAESTR